MSFFLAAPDLHARSCRPDLIPNGHVESCSNCHFSASGGGDRNPFGQDVEARLRLGGTLCEEDTFWDAGLAALDSDGDGRSNGTELQDPEGSWRPGDPDPGIRELVTIPGLPDDPPVEKNFLRGDSNGDRRIDISDAIFVLNFLFRGLAEPPCFDAANTNADRGLDLGDAIFMLSFVFRGGRPPPRPFPDCALGVERLGCENYPPCV
jgi:hypothetical protein